MLSEPWQVTQGRRQLAAQTFPTLGPDANASATIGADDWGVAQGKPVSDFSQTTMGIATQAAQTFDQPDAAPNVQPWTPDAGPDTTLTPDVSPNAEPWNKPVQPSWTQVASGQSYDEGYQPAQNGPIAPPPPSHNQAPDQWQPQPYDTGYAPPTDAYPSQGGPAGPYSLGNVAGTVAGAGLGFAGLGAMTIAGMAKSNYDNTLGRVAPNIAGDVGGIFGKMGQFGNYLPIGTENQQAVNNWVGQQGVAGEALNQLPQWVTGGAELGPLRTGLGIAGQLAAEHYANALPNDTPYIGAIRAAAPFVGGSIGAAGPEIANLARSGASALDRFASPAVLPSEASQVGRVPGTDSFIFDRATVQRAGQLNTIRDSLANARSAETAGARVLADGEALPKHSASFVTPDGEVVVAPSGTEHDALANQIKGDGVGKSLNNLMNDDGWVTVRQGLYGPDNLVVRVGHQAPTPNQMAAIEAAAPGHQIDYILYGPTGGDSGAMVQHANFEQFQRAVRDTYAGRPQSEVAQFHLAGEQPNALDTVIGRSEAPTPLSDIPAERRAQIIEQARLNAQQPPTAGGTDIPGGQEPFMVPRGGPEPTGPKGFWGHRVMQRSNVTPEEAFRAGLREEPPAEPFGPTAAESAIARTERAMRRSLGDTAPVSPMLENAPAVQQFKQRILDAKPLQEAQDAARSALRSRQAGAFSWSLESGNGEAGMQRAIGAMRGQMDRPTFEPLRQYLDQPQVDELANHIINSDVRPFEKANAYQAMTSILDGRVPTPSSLAQLERVFPGVTDSLEKAKIISPQGSTAIQKVAEVMNLWRTIKTAWDVSAPGKQGLMLAAGHPREFFGNMPQMVKAFANKKTAEAFDAALHQSENAELWRESGLYVAPLDGASIGAREEAFMSRIARYFPGVERSERAYVNYLNGLRTQVFDSMWGKLPAEAQTLENGQRIARWVNSSTGRGTIPEALQDWAAVANGVLFSPRFMISRFESNGLGVKAIADLAKQGLTRQALDPVSKQIAGDYVKFLGATAGAIALAKASGANVNIDPRSSEFGQVQVGNTRYDLTAGNATLIRYFTQFGTGQRIAPDATNVTDYPLSKTATNFMRSKLSPAFGLLWDATIGQGRTPGGLKLTDTSLSNVRDVLLDEFAPMIVNDITEAYRKNNFGPAGAALGLPAIGGIGVNTYDAPSSGATYSPDSRHNSARPSR